MCHAVKQAGHQVWVSALLWQNGGLLPKLVTEQYTDEAGLPTHILIIRWRFCKALPHLWPLLSWLFQRHIRRTVIPSFRPQLIHAHVIYPAGLLAADVARKLGVPWLLTEHWSRAENFLRGAIWKTTARKALATAAAVTAVSPHLLAALEPWLPQNLTRRVVPNVVDVQSFRYARKLKSDTTLRLLAAATWAPPKLPMLLCDALARWLHAADRPVELTIAGEGPLLIPLRRRVQQQGLPVKFTGFVDKPRLAVLMQQADFFVHASESETFCLVAAEALCCGTPVIASDLPALRALVCASCGLLTANTAEAWLAALQQAAQTNFDCSSCARELARQLSAEAVAGQFTALYELMVPGR